jgi:cytoskeletal protein RodZ
MGIGDLAKGFDPEQIEHLRQLGNYLRDQRLAKSVSLETIAHKTYIPLRLLQAIEQGQVERLPEPVYVRGFIRRYADAIGLDGKTLAENLTVEPSPILVSVPDTSASTSPTAAPAPVVPVIHQPVDEYRRSRGSVSNLPKLSHLLWGALGLIGLGLLGSAAAGMFNQHKTNLAGMFNQPKTSEQVPKPTESVASKPTTPASLTPNQSPTSATAKAPSTQNSDTPVQVSFTLTEDAWMEIDVDGEQKYAGTMTKGTQQSYSAKRELVVTTGNAGAVQLSYNQADPRPMGDLGEIQALKFSANTSKPTPVQ